MPTASKPKKRRSKRVELPAELRDQKVTPAKLARGAYQKKVAAFYAPHIIPKAFQALIDGLDSGDPAARRQAFEVFGILQTKLGTSVTVNTQTNVDARASARERGEAAEGLGSFEEIARTVSGERDRRLLTAPGSTRAIEAKFEPTPED